MENIGFLAHGFLIIDLVPESEMQTGRHIEENLLDFIHAEKSELFCERRKCETKYELMDTFNMVKKRLEDKGEITYIHIEGHASKESLKFPDGLTISWGTVFEQLREINIMCRNNLFFSSGACQSAYAFKAASITEPSPIFGMLAPEQEVEAGGALDGYIAFYKSLIQNESLNNAFNSFADETDGKKYALIFSQLLFKKAAYNYIKQYCMGRGRRERVENALSKVMNSTNIQLKKARRELKKELNKPQARNLKRLHDKFMMLDKFPENKNRFEFNAVKFEQKVKRGELIIV